MPLTPLPEAPHYSKFSLVCLNATGQFVRPGKDVKEFRDGKVVAPADLPGFFKQKIYLPQNVTDVFVWVHGWNNTHAQALSAARRLFSGLDKVHAERKDRYPRLASFEPAFVAVRWPSLSRATPGGYASIRDRAAALTDKREAEFFLASLLGYLEEKNVRTAGKKLAAKGGFYVHCVGHSFGGRFLTAAIRAAGNPQPKTVKLLSAAGKPARKVLSATSPVNGFDFTVDSMLVFQMAAPCRAFGIPLQALVDRAPLRGPVVLTFSKHDRANCIWHRLAGDEHAIGCTGAVQPAAEVGTIPFHGLDQVYDKSDFGKRIINVNASDAFTKKRFRVEGAHSDFWYKEAMHLLLSLVNHVHA